MEEIKAMLTELAGSRKIEINNLNHVVPFEEAIGKDGMYFLGGVEDRTKRNKDDDIKRKCYVFVDIDIRTIHKEKTGEILSDDQLNEEIDKILNLLKEKDFDWWRYAVHSGNGLHLYYVGKEAEIDKTTYSKGVQVFYNEINQALSPLGYVCDKACHNIARISRLPGSINSRTKFGLDPIECKIIKVQPSNENGIIELLPAYVEMHEEMNNKTKEVEKEMKRYVRDSTDIWAEINRIPIGPIVCDHLGLTLGKETDGNIIPLKHNSWNIGAYVYTPYNIVTTTGTTRIPEGTYTTYEFVSSIICSGNTKATKEYFESKYGIKFNQNEKRYLEAELQLPTKKYFENEIYKYPDPVFDDEFESLRSGELVLVASPTNCGKSTFVQGILTRNKDKHKCLYINLEFDLQRGREDARKRSRGMKVKIKGSKEDPYTQSEKTELDLYLAKCMTRMEILDLSQGTKLVDIIAKIKEHIENGYSLFVVDTFSSIENADKYETQNIISRTFHDICKITGACIILVHHFNKTAKEISGSQKLSDLANVVVTLQPEEVGPTIGVRYKLVKDKAFFGTREKLLLLQNFTYKEIAEADL